MSNWQKNGCLGTFKDKRFMKNFYNVAENWFSSELDSSLST